ncbi:enoyl-CoA hydratase-related protein [soil metagenome]
MSIDLAIDGHVAIVTINRPEKKNALTLDMRSEVQTIFQQVQDDPEVRAIVLTGAGSDFSAGADLSEAGTGGVAGSIHKMRLLHRMLRGVSHTNKPVIANVKGACIGMSWSMALACDFIVAADDARFQFAFRHVGLAPDGGASFLLARYVGLQRAKEIIYSGRFVSGREAADLGLALEVLPADQVMERALEMAQGFAAAPTIALQMMKRQFDASPAQTLDQALDFEANIQPLMVQTEDFREGVDSFRQKRKPVFKGT